MIRSILAFTFLVFVSLASNAQDDKLITPSDPRQPKGDQVQKKATIDLYRIITLDRDTTYVDTSLTIQSEYRFNYLRHDIFGLMPFANEGQPYNLLDFTEDRSGAFPEFGFSAKHFNYMQAADIRYYSVATPLTELYFKSVMEQGQTLDAFITLNTSERFNMSIAYKGLRSLGKYINQLTSAGNFRFTASYNTLNKRYFANFHFVAQDLLNGENGGIVSNQDFEGENNEFQDRARLEVYLKDAESFLRGNRVFLDHRFKINKSSSDNALFVDHRFMYERKFFEFVQPTIASQITFSDGTQATVNRFGDAYVTSNLRDRAYNNRMHNRVGLAYENQSLGRFRVFADDYRFNYYFDKILILDSGTIPGSLSDELIAVGGEYQYKKGRWDARASYQNAVSGPAMSDANASIAFEIDKANQVSVAIKNLNKIPDHIYNLHQSDYAAYNWSNDFKNEKTSEISAIAKTKWLNATATFRTIDDHLYFSNDAADPQLLVTPKQFGQTLSYLSLKASKEFRYRKFALDNTVLYQKVNEQGIINVPELTTRNTLYFSDHFFKKALYLQTGITLNYFTSYFANEYNPLIGEFFVQQQREIGNFPMLDFFVNARVRQTRIFLKAEHFNSPFTGNNFYSSPGYPYRDFIVRFGLVWNFFQ